MSRRCPHCGKSPRGGAHFCEPLADEVEAWFPKRLVHTKGRWAGVPFDLKGWQATDIIRPIFGQLVWEPEVKAWVRQVGTAYIEIPRKNGKSELGAGIGLKLAFADGEPGAEVYSVAEDLDQANKVFAVAQKMVEASPAMSRRLQVYKRLIENPATGSIYRVIPGDAAGNHGHNPHGVVFDELHTQPNRDLWDVMTSGSGTRSQALAVAFSTAGTDRLSICREQHDYGERIASRVLEDPSFHYVRYGVPEDDTEWDWEDEALWRACNPALGDFLLLSYLRKEYRKAKASPARQNAFRRLYLNEWTGAHSRWLDLGRWDATAGLVVEEKLGGLECFVGIDASHKTGLVAACWIFAGENEHRAVWRYWLPADSLSDLDDRTAGQASVWVREGRLELTEGDIVDYRKVARDIVALSGRFDVQEVAVKPGGISVPLAQELQEHEFTVIEMSQTPKSLGSGTEELERLVLESRFRHGGHPVIRWQVDATQIRRDKDNRIKPDPEKSFPNDPVANISGVTAAVMALGRSIVEAAPEDVPGELVSF